jgi:acetyltransferase
MSRRWRSAARHPDAAPSCSSRRPPPSCRATDIARALVPLRPEDAIRSRCCQLLARRPRWPRRARCSGRRHRQLRHARAGGRRHRHAGSLRRNQAELLRPRRPTQLHNGSTPDVARVRALVQAGAGQGRDMLTEPEAKAVLRGLSHPGGDHPRGASRSRGRGRRGRAIGFPVVSRSCPRTSRTSPTSAAWCSTWQDADDVRAAASAMLARIGKSGPQARLDGFSVQAMVRRKQARELIVGASIDPTVRPGDPVRPGWHGGRGGGRQRHGAAAAQRPAGARAGAAHPRGPPAGRLPRHAGGRPGCRGPR